MPKKPDFNPKATLPAVLPSLPQAPGKREALGHYLRLAYKKL